MKKKPIPFHARSPYGWWIASYIERFELKRRRALAPSSKHLAYENTILIKATSREIAYRKALAIGRKNCWPKWTLWGKPPGKMGRWVFEGLTSLLPVYEKLQDGAEISWTDLRGATLGSIRRRVKSKSELEVFHE
jgi:hypothetical protein